MRSLAWISMVAVLTGLEWGVSGAFAQQQVTAGSPYRSVGDSFFENMGTSWGLRGRNWFFNVFGSPTQAAPQFGGFDPSAGANFGFGFGWGGASGYFLGNFSQGSRRSFTSLTPSVTLQNGYPGGIFDSSQSPFVISYTPVVGGFPTGGALMPAPPRPVCSPEVSMAAGSPVQRALAHARQTRRPADDGELGRIEAPRPQAAPAAAAPAGQGAAVARGPASRDGLAARQPKEPPSSAERPAMSVAEARRLHLAEQSDQTSDDALQYVERARGAEAAGKSNVARIYYQMAERRATGPLREEIHARLKELEVGP